jgi:hypothetical protein
MRLNFILLELVELMDDDGEADGFKCGEYRKCENELVGALHAVPFLGVLWVPDLGVSFSVTLYSRCLALSVVPVPLGFLRLVDGVVLVSDSVVLLVLPVRFGMLLFPCTGKGYEVLRVFVIVRLEDALMCGLLVSDTGVSD